MPLSHVFLSGTLTGVVSACVLVFVLRYRHLLIMLES